MLNVGFPDWFSRNSDSLENLSVLLCAHRVRLSRVDVKFVQLARELICHAENCMSSKFLSRAK
jgi:hypothetical protein